MKEEEFYEFLETTNTPGEKILHIFEIDDRLSLCTQEESFRGKEIDRSQCDFSPFLKKFEEENSREEIDPPYLLEEIAYFSYLLSFEKGKKVCPYCVGLLYSKSPGEED